MIFRISWKDFKPQTSWSASTIGMHCWLEEGRRFPRGERFVFFVMGIECLDLGERFALFVPTLSGLQGGWADRGIGPYGGPPERSG